MTVLGRLDEFTAGYGLVVTPVVGVIPAHCEFRLDPAETTAVASVRIESLMEQANFSQDGDLSPVIGTWISIIVLTPIGLFLSYKAANDSVLFDMEAYKRFFNKLIRRKEE